jgi:hypothetical protein
MNDSVREEQDADRQTHVGEYASGRVLRERSPMRAHHSGVMQNAEVMRSRDVPP